MKNRLYVSLNDERKQLNMIDQTDIEILKLLEENSRMQWQQIGEIVHMTGQSVKNRIDKLEKMGVIEGYTINIDQNKLGNMVLALITVYMKTTDHAAFQKYISASELVKEAYRISGDGCYFIKIYAKDQSELIGFLDGILPYGNYKVNISIDKMK